MSQYQSWLVETIEKMSDLSFPRPEGMRSWVSPKPPGRPLYLETEETVEMGNRNSF